MYALIDFNIEVYFDQPKIEDDKKYCVIIDSNKILSYYQLKSKNGRVHCKDSIFVFSNKESENEYLKVSLQSI